ncbi:helicase-exonuclease AddAB subunit AddA [Paenibacillus sediminis]|nr:helicase-exonuclease AddAB subunit AddA [Paenibacillus sediminis]
MWSDDQWKAISLSGTNMLVAAAAGSGKTAVLVERIIRKIADREQGTSVDRLLVATFTKAAAAEMRQRIREALDNELEKDPHNDHLRRQLALLGRASITTLHSFCLEVIQRYYALIPLDPGFRIASESEVELMRQELLEELFEEKYASEDEGTVFRRLVDWFSGERSDDAVYGLVQRLYDFARSHSWPDYWLREMADAFQLSDMAALEKSSWVKSIVTDALLTLRGVKGMLEQALALTQVAGGPAPYGDNLTDDIALIHRLLDAVQHGGWASMYEAFQAVAFTKLKPVKKDQVDPNIQERVKGLREQAKKAVLDLKGQLFGRPPEAFLQEMQEAAPLMKELAELVIAFSDRYQAQKAAKGMLDFSDLEHYCLQILRHKDSRPDHIIPSAAALEYQAQFDEVLLDEYQDTNTVQEEIVKLISREGAGNRFMVGDVKQSIYRFRLADPGLFLDKYRVYTSDLSSAEAESTGLRIDLARNFRSRVEVVHAVNMLFRQIMNKTVAEITYDSSAELVYGASFPDPLPEQPGFTPELVLIDRGEGEMEDGDSSSAETEEGGTSSQESEAVEMESAQLEARFIAAKIREMMGESGKPFHVYDKSLKAMRPVSYRDIVILLRSTQVWAPLMIEELRLEGIPAFGELNRGYFQATEVEVMLSLLQIIDNPQQDIPLAAVLRSPLIGLNEEQLAQIRLAGGKGMSYYDALCVFANAASAQAEIAEGLQQAAATSTLEIPSQPNEQLELSLEDNQISLQQKLRDFLSQLEAWRDEARHGDLSDLIWHIYRKTGYLEWVGGLPGGAQRQANLYALYDRARQYEQSTSSRGLFRFLRFIARLKENGGDLGAVGSSSEQEDVVRIMTIHKSKGLEFPVVFIAGMSKMFNQQDLNAPFLMHKELGFGPKFVDGQMRVSYPTLPNLAIRRRAQLELLAEEMRVLYVGLTRPKEKMILVATVKDLAKKVASWSQVGQLEQLVLPDDLLARGRSYLDWVGPALIRHPAAHELRKLGGSGETGSSVLIHDPSEWKISIVHADHIQSAAAGLASLEQPNGMDAEKLKAVSERHPVQTDSGLGETIDRILSWTYTNPVPTKIAAKTSVTEMKRMLELDEYLSENLLEQEQMVDESTRQMKEEDFRLHLRRPKFMEEKKMTPTERGTAYHTLMQHVPLDAGAVDRELIAQTLMTLVDKQILLPEQASQIDISRVVQFFATELCSELLRAKWVRREMPFSYGLPILDAYPYLSSDVMKTTERLSVGHSPFEEETVLVQGVVDCLFEVDDKLILLDYKSDKVLEHRGGVQALTERYRFQLDLYGRALEHILKRQVHEKWLYFLDSGELVKL